MVEPVELKLFNILLMSPGAGTRFSGKINWIQRTAQALESRGHRVRIGVVGICSGAIRNRKDSIMSIWPVNDGTVDPAESVLMVPEIMASQGATVAAKTRVLILRTPTHLSGHIAATPSIYDAAITFSDEGTHVARDLVGIERVVRIREVPYPDFLELFDPEYPKQKQIAIRMDKIPSPSAVVYELLRIQLGREWKVVPFGFMEESAYRRLLKDSMIVVDIPYEEGSYMTLVEAALAGCLTVGWKNPGWDTIEGLPGCTMAEFGSISSVLDAIDASIRQLYDSRENFAGLAAEAERYVMRRGTLDDEIDAVESTFV